MRTPTNNIRRLGLWALKLLRHPKLLRFVVLKLRTKGMLSPEIYSMYYEAAKRANDLDIVEVGGASGASGIAIALGMKRSGKKSNLIIVEKCEGGSRLSTGDYSENYAVLIKNITKYGVSGKVRLFPHYMSYKNGKEVVEMVETQQIGALIHDADGRVDRDFFFFYQLLTDQALIIIDDYENKSEYREISARYPDGGTKKITTYRLVQQMLDWGLLEIDAVEKGTLFGHKPNTADFSNFDRKECEHIVAKVMKERASQYNS